MTSRFAGLRVMLLSLCGIGFITLVGSRLIFATPTTIALLLLLVVSLTAIATRLIFSIVAALVATFCLDFFFLPPVGSITVTDPQDWITLLVFCAISLIAGQLSRQLRMQRDELMEQQRESEKIHSLSRSLLMNSSADDIRRLIVNLCMQLFNFEEFALFDNMHGTLHRSHTESPSPEAAMRAAAKETKVLIKVNEWTLVPVSLGNLRSGSIGFVRLTALPASTVQSLASTIALGLAQVQAQEAAGRAHAERRSEELKSVMIDALAHDLKTPLTSIEAAADMLAGSASLSPLQATDMLAVIQEETRGLRRLVDEATHLARIDAKRLKLTVKSEPVPALIRSAIQSLGDRLGNQRIAIHIPSDLNPVLGDSELLVHALKQLLDNALKYGPPLSIVNVQCSEVEAVVTISVRDSGPGLTELEQSKVFDKFYRGRHDRSAIQGTGMGLSIAREIVEAHGGSVGVRSYVGQGTEFFVCLRALTAVNAPPKELIA